MVWIVGLSETPALIHAHNSSHVTKIRHSYLETCVEKEADNRNRFQELSLTKPFKHSFGLADTKAKGTSYTFMLPCDKSCNVHSC